MAGVLVGGPQCSGCKAVARMLVVAGGGLTAGNDYLGGDLPRAGHDGRPLVFHQSMPQGRMWNDFAELCRRHRLDQAIVCVRSFVPHLRSMVDTQEYGGKIRPWGTTGHHPDMSSAVATMQEAYPAIFAQLHSAGVPYRVVTYRELAEEPGARRALAQWCGLEPDPAEAFDFAEGNSKWYC